MNNPQVRVYRNLNNGKISLQCYATRLILGHCDAVYLEDVHFVVGEQGRLRVIAKRQKNVHAFVVGTLKWASGFSSFRGRSIKGLDTGALDAFDGYQRIRYNPYLMNQFSTLDGQAVFQSRGCWVSSQSGVYARI